MTKHSYLKIGLIPQIVVFLAGFSFLVFEISWNRILSLYLGSTVFASTLVLATFMGGLGFGGMFWGRYINKYKPQKYLLAALFGIIALLGLINYGLFNFGLAGLYEAMADTNIVLRESIVYLVAFIMLIVSAFFMGGVLPSIAKILIRSNQQIRHHMGHIYGLETLGSTLGGLITGFLLLGQLGQQNTLIVGVVVMLVLALVAWQYMPLPHSEQQTEATETDQKRTKKFADWRKPALMLTFMCGLSVIALQVIWVRMLKVYLTNTSYTFSLIASLVIAGLFAGSWYYKSGKNTVKAPGKRIALLFILLAALSVFGLVVLLNLPEAMLFPLHEAFNTHFTRLLIIPVVVSIIVILPVAAVSGYAFPFAVDLYTNSYHNVGRNVGRIMLANALGSFVGPLIAAFMFIPLAGAGRSILLVAILLFFALILVLRHLPEGERKTPKVISLVSIALLFLVTISGLHMRILPPSFHIEDKKVLHYNEAVQGTLVVGEERRGNNAVKSTYVNNASVIGSSYDAIKAVKMVGHMPFFAGLEAQKALIVGFGIGVTTSAIASHEEIKQIDCVELVPGLKKAARYYSALNNNIVNDPRLTIHGDDGRHFLQSTSESYDLISSDPTHPVLGSGNLYTTAYFELYKKHLNPGGMVTQYLPLHKLNRNDLLGLIKTFHHVFPHTVVWLGHYHAVLMGSTDAVKIDFEKWSSRIADFPKDPYFYANPYHLAANLIFDHKAIENFPEEVKINTDDRSYVEFFDFSVFREENLPQNLAYLNFKRDGVFRVFQNIPDTMKMKRFIEANKMMTRGIEGMLRNDKDLLYRQLQKAAQIAPENEELPFLLKLYFRE